MKIPTPIECGLSEKFTSWRSNQEHAIDVMITSGKRFVAMSAPTGFGKCFSPGTMVMMADGVTSKAVEDIQIGDEVMGWDSNPRTVVNLARGTGEMFRIQPIKGSSYIVNSEHVLSLVLTPEKSDAKAIRSRVNLYVDIPLNLYLHESKWFKHRAKGYRVPIDFYGQDKPLPLPPYFLGLWLGDGTALAPDVTTADSEIVRYVEELADKWGMRVHRKDKKIGCPTYGFRNVGVGNRFATNPVSDALRELGVWGNKHVPSIYKTASEFDRRSILAGLLDSDGNLIGNCFEFSSELRVLAQDVCFVARSVGLAAYLKPCLKSDQNGTEGLYYRVTISGDTDMVPTILPRKRATPRQQKKNVLRTGIKVVPVGMGDFYGFGVSGKDQKFLLADFTVVHNSPAYVAYALLSGKPTCVVTNSKGLQTQLMDDYASSGMVDIRGRSNYQCALRDDYSCSEGYAARCPYKGSINCPSSQAEMRASSSSLVVTNYDKWISCSRSTDGWLSHFEQIVLDEGHDAPDALARAMQFVITPDDVEKVLELEYPMRTAEFGSWKGWACGARVVAEEKMKDWERRLNSEMSPKASWIKQLLHLRRLVKRLSVIATGRYDNWVVEEVERGFQFDAVRLGQYAEGILFLGKKKIVVVSATLRPKTMHMLGLRKDTFDFYEFDSDFDSSRCPIYYIPTMRVDARVKDLGMLWVRLDQIMSRRTDRKGIIDPISFARRDEVMKASRHVGRMITNQRGESITHVLEAFRSASPGTVLISPSVGTGYDFPGKQCEWQFICKVPFPDGRAKIQQARQADDKEYGPYGAMQTLVQFFGRGMRSKQDRCEGFISDDHLQWFLPKYRHLAPKSFHSHFRMVNTVPPPPEAL